MTANMNRYSTYTSTSVGPDDGEEKKKDMWSSMLDDVASGKRLPEKNMLVLGMPFNTFHQRIACILRTVADLQNRRIGGIATRLPRISIKQ